ncbi:MAG TPA: phosphotransferase [Anaerolineales bacterium]|nr:phosphotransferase [Anaerolineales bacterium]
MPKPFSTLTHLGQARRLRILSLNAMQEYPLNVKSVRLLQHSYNTIFRVDTMDGQKYVIRVNVPNVRARENILAEMTWLAALGRDTTLGIPAPRANRDGELVTTATARGVPEPRHCAVFGWVPGKELAHQISPEYYEKLGRFTAQLHNHAEAFVPPPDFSLKKLDVVFPFDHGNFLEDDAISPEWVTPERRKVFEAAAQRIEGLLNALYASTRPPFVLHADLHQWNIRVHREALYVLDFDDTMIGHPAQDIAITFYYIQAHPEYETLKAAFQTGYEALRPWPVESQEQLAGLLAWRGLDLLNFVLYTDNPGIRRGLPAFVERMEARVKNYLQVG